MTFDQNYKIAIGIMLLTLMINSANAIPYEEWNNTYYRGVPYEGYYAFFNSVQQTKDGGYIAVGGDGIIDENDYTIILKTDANGNKLWSKSFGLTGGNGAMSVNQTRDGDYIVAGTYEANAWLSRIDTNGNKIWSNIFNYVAAFYSTQQTKDGGYIVVGYGNDGAWLIKTDVNGNKLWSKIFGEYNYTDSVQQTKDGGYIVAGGYGGFWGNGRDNVWLAKTDANGNKLWSKTFGWAGDDYVNSVQQTKDGGYIIGGNTLGTGGRYVWLIKTDSLGNKQWSKTFGEGGGGAAQQTIDGGYIVVGDGNDGAWLIKTDVNGNKLWKWNKSGHYYASSVQQTKDGGYIMVGDLVDYITSAGLIKLSAEKSIGIISPNGGENLVRGTTNTIRWKTTDGIGTYIKIELLKGGVLNSIISSSTPNDGSYNWTIPLTQPLGINYKTRITSTSNSVYKDTSNNNFTISSANLLKNPGFESSSGSVPIYWNKYQTGTRAIFTYPEIGRTGGKSVSIRYVTRETGKVALWSQSGIVVVPSKQYKLSGYMKLSNVTGGGIGRLNGASLRINWYRSDGGLIKVDLITKSGTNIWTRYEKTFAAPSNAVKANIGGDLYNASGKVWFDDLSFVKVS